ncbi:hypothetical protein BaRGS_00014079 [Batillaria attramentaria]|uniref:ShKT domain-containing protein n=1 Tax=Batillaria attramentaria TaxID=370345 RepID=A0ABD0L559_9CAEN
MIVSESSRFFTDKVLLLSQHAAATQPPVAHGAGNKNTITQLPPSSPSPPGGSIRPGRPTGPTSSTAATVCEDRVSHCDEYGPEDCTQYQDFMRSHCSRFCGFCSDVTTTVVPGCTDQMTNCAQYGRESCLAYDNFRNVQCRAFCHNCLGDVTL